MRNHQNSDNDGIVLDDAPYSYVRTVVMRTLLIPKSEYIKLVKMGISEISAHLSETEYRKELDEFGVEFSGIDLVEHALFRNFLNTISKLKRICPQNYNQLIDVYLLHYDINNIKSIIRGKIANLPEKEIKGLMLPHGMIAEKALDLLIKKDSVESVISALNSPLNRLAKEYSGFKDKDLKEIETALDRIYFKELLSFAGKVPQQGILFRDFIYTLISCSNILTLFRLKKENLQPAEIEKYLFYTPQDGVFLRRLLQAKSTEEIAELIKHSKFDKVIPLDASESGKSLIPLEISLQKHIYSKAMRFVRQDPMSVYTILSYLFAKEMEIKNILNIVKAKYLKIDEEKIIPLLVA